MKRSTALLCLLALLCAALSAAPALGEGESWVCPSCGMIVTQEHGEACPVCGLRMPPPTPEQAPAGESVPSASPVPAERAFPQAGDHITFGRFPQKAAGTDQTPVEWLVLEVDEENHKALLLSRYGLLTMPYNNVDFYTTWEMCSLRSWLNTTFLRKAFTEEERQSILETELDNRQKNLSRMTTYPGNDTTDRIFLLSYSEANRYLGVDDEHRNEDAGVKLTEYAAKQAAIAGDGKTPRGGWCWWLRSAAYDTYFGLAVGQDGSLSLPRVSLTYYSCVRPALWLDLDFGLYGSPITDESPSSDSRRENP